ncbi:MAG: right-handed parallel beta-helix repeat-containing protein, partial [Armatimonadota bacterium]|nr:right-handed parallel beta-helix repeat-containing protein [Armatimonadota bacterium]
MRQNRIYRLLLGTTLLLQPLTSSCAAAPQTGVGKPLVAPERAVFTRTLHVDAAATATASDGSEQKPFTTIDTALKAAQPGDGIVVRGGVYREEIRMPSGSDDAPITLMAAAGQRVIVSGFAPITGWQPFKDKIQVATLDWKPDGLFVNRTLQPMSQSPNEGWYVLQAVQEDGGGLRLTDAERLKNFPHDLKGGHVLVLQKTGNVIGSSSIMAQDKAVGTVTIEKARWMRAQAGDPYQLKNHVALIDRPGEWAFEKTGENQFKVYFWPSQPGDLQSTQSRQATRELISGNGAKHVRIEGLEVTGSQSDGIAFGRNSSDVTVTRCIASGNGGNGIRFRNVSDSAITRNIVVNNANGISVLSAKNILVENNEVAFNEVDGIIVAGDVSGRYGQPGANPDDTTSNVVVRRNYVHHHLLSGHPDNFQMYRGVRNVKLIENVSIGGGQGLMMEEVDDGELTGNVFVSSAANMILFGHGNTNNWTMRGNTFAHPGYSIFSFTGKDYEARENVFVGPLSNLHPTYKGDSNLFTVLPRGAKFEKYSSIADIATGTGQEKNSLLANDLPLRSAPHSHAVGEHLLEATREMVYLRDAEDFKAGDVIEINWDGVARTVTKVEATTVERDGKTRPYTKVLFTPALPALPLRYVVVANWGERKDLLLDTRLLPDSPAAKMAPGGGAIGAAIDVATFQ